MTENKTKQYSDNQYNRTSGHELGSGFSNYDRLMVELNSRQYTDNAGNEADHVVLTWNIISDFEVEQIINGSQITLCADDEKMDGNTFVLQVIADSSVMDEMEILVKGEI